MIPTDIKNLIKENGQDVVFRDVFVDKNNFLLSQKKRMNSSNYSRTHVSDMSINLVSKI